MLTLRNERHERFAAEIAKGRGAAEAYRAAGYQCARHKARGHGHRLRTRGDIAARIDELSANGLARIAGPKPAAKNPRKRKPKARTLPKFQRQRPGQPTP